MSSQYIQEVVQKIALQLLKHHWKLVTAESCTGGLLSASFTEIPGSSLWFERGFVTYSNQSKIEMLNVPRLVLDEYGAVSQETAVAMVLGALKNSAGNVAVSITGIAGPDGGSAEKPVGLVHFAWCIKGAEPKAQRKYFAGTRQEIRLAACAFALEGLFSLF